MARTRELVRDLFQHLVAECEEIINPHPCGRYCDHNSRCIVCSAAQPKYAVVYAALAREKALLGEVPLTSELALLNILGEERFNRILKEQRQKYLSGPETVCAGCGLKLKVYGSYGENYRAAARRGGLNIPCVSCGTGTRLLHTNMRPPKSYNPKTEKPLLTTIVRADGQVVVNGTNNWAFTTTTTGRTAEEPLEQPVNPRPQEPPVPWAPRRPEEDGPF